MASRERSPLDLCSPYSNDELISDFFFIKTMESSTAMHLVLTKFFQPRVDQFRGGEPRQLYRNPHSYSQSFFPPIDADSPDQSLIMKDIRNNAWEFLYSYCGPPPRNWFTLSWKNFVKTKCIAEGDSTVFIKKESTDELFIGVRRAQMIGLLSVGAIENVAKEIPFEVVYFPRAGSQDFCGERGEGEGFAGMRVKMAVET